VRQLWEKLQHELSSYMFYLAHWLADELTTARAKFSLANVQGMQERSFTVDGVEREVLPRVRKALRW